MNKKLFLTVNEILEKVKKEKDKALQYYTEKFDNVIMSEFKVTEEEVQAAYQEISSEFLTIIESASQNIEKFHKKQIVESYEYTEEGILLGQKVEAIRRVGLYIPGGKASYPSSVLMNAIPAFIAGVEEIVMVSPPMNDGRLNPYVVVAADYLGIKEIYKIGGAQSIGALAYGTESIAKVDMIVGPGNQYVAEAKRQVFGVVSIDMIAGPSEIAVLADDTSNPKYIARDLLSQAEHDEEARLFLLCTSKEVIQETKKALEEFIQTIPKKEIIEKSIENLVCIYDPSVNVLIKEANAIAPEHLEVLFESPETYLDQIKNAGSIFLGAYTPESVGDYWAGPNHTLPTSATARFSSPLGVYDFIKRRSYIKYSKEALSKVGEDIIKFAEIEGLYSHGASVKERLNNE